MWGLKSSAKFANGLEEEKVFFPGGSEVDHDISLVCVPPMLRYSVTGKHNGETGA